MGSIVQKHNVHNLLIVIQIHYLFFIKSDIRNMHLTNLIQRIDDSISSLTVNVEGQIHGVKVEYLWKIFM